MSTPKRPDPDQLLAGMRDNDIKKSGQLRIFFGYAAGVGKTYAMLTEAHQLEDAGVDVLVGYIEPHTRPETMELLDGLSILPPLQVVYKNMTLREFDLDAALERHPQVILVDELAHTNAPGQRNKKRYQDVEELLKAGIDVYTTVNVQHIESLNDVVHDITGIGVRETVPDYIFENADIRLIDITPGQLLQRLAEGKIYRSDRAAAAVESFFMRDNLRALREMSMRASAEQVGQRGDGRADAHGGKILVCISSAPGAARCIRWAARMSEAIHEPFVVLHVETRRTIEDGEREEKVLSENLKLAERLGGTSVTLYGSDIASVVADYATKSGVTNIVVGKHSGPRSWTFRPEFEDRLLQMLDSSVEIHIVSYAEEHKKKRSQFALAKNYLSIRASDILKSIGILVLATVVGLVLWHFGLVDVNVIMIYLLAVLVIALVTRGYLHGAISSAFAVLLFNFLFIEPRFTFKAIEVGYPVTFAIMLVVAFVSSALATLVRSQAHFAIEARHRVEALSDLNTKLLVTRGLENIMQVSAEYTESLFGRSVIFYAKDPRLHDGEVLYAAPDDANAAILGIDDERAVAHWAFANQKWAGKGTDTLAGAKGIYMPLISQKETVGVMGLSCVEGGAISQEQHELFRMVGSLLALAIERQNLSDEQREMLIETEREQMRANLLRAISHDLRTPLTNISGATAAILENDNIDPGTQRELLTGVHQDAEWLVRMIENLLSVTRIHDGGLGILKTPEAAEELVGEALERTKKRFPHCDIEPHVPLEPLFVPVDATLIVQVLMNLLENAIRHSGACDPETGDSRPIEVNVCTTGDDAVFEVADHGKGIEPDRIEHLFEGNTSGDGTYDDSSRGLGIGLSICRSIVQAHGGSIEAENRPEGGALIHFSLPLGVDQEASKEEFDKAAE